MACVVAVLEGICSEGGKFVAPEETRVLICIDLWFSCVPQQLRICHYFFKHAVALNGPPVFLEPGCGRAAHLPGGWKTRQAA